MCLIKQHTALHFYCYLVPQREFLKGLIVRALGFGAWGTTWMTPLRISVYDLPRQLCSFGEMQSPGQSG